METIFPCCDYENPVSVLQSRKTLIIWRRRENSVHERINLNNLWRIIQNEISFGVMICEKKKISWSEIIIRRLVRI